METGQPPPDRRRREVQDREQLDRHGLAEVQVRADLRQRKQIGDSACLCVLLAERASASALVMSQEIFGCVGLR